MKREITIGLAVVAGAAALEAALVPGLILGGAAWLAPRLLRSARKAGGRTVARAKTETGSRKISVKQPTELLAKSHLGRTIAKTITFRIVVTTLDFTTNYIVIGELATAAGLSTFNLIAGPLFYFTHEAVWNHLGRADAASAGIRLQLPDAGDRVHHQPGTRQDDHLPDHRDDRGLLHELRRRRYGRGSDDPVGHRFLPWAICVFRPREGLGVSGRRFREDWVDRGKSPCFPHRARQLICLEGDVLISRRMFALS
jgi:uncharacterized membrane protein